MGWKYGILVHVDDIKTPLPHVDKRGYFETPPSSSTWFKDDPFTKRAINTQNKNYETNKAKDSHDSISKLFQ